MCWRFPSHSLSPTMWRRQKDPLRHLRTLRLVSIIQPRPKHRWLLAVLLHIARGQKQMEEWLDGFFSRTECDKMTNSGTKTLSDQSPHPDVCLFNADDPFLLLFFNMFSIWSTIEAVTNSSAILGAFPHVVGSGTGEHQQFHSNLSNHGRTRLLRFSWRPIRHFGNKPETTKNKKIFNCLASSAS